MKQSEETPTEIKKRRTRRSPEKIVELVMEAERTGNAAEICRREGWSAGTSPESNNLST